MAVASVADRGPAYGIPGISVDGTDVLAVYEVTRRAVERARRGDGPTLIEARVVRLTAHSSDDNDRTYRSPRELKSMRLNDPIARFAAYLHEHELLSEADERELRAEAAAEVDAATAAAEAAPLPEPEMLLKHVYAE
jgi:2-oxoisovalerate dehydrogenase E1 component alpha subunit